MSKTSSCRGQPILVRSKSPSLRKELQGSRSRMLRIGERLMRAGSEGNLVQRPISTKSQSHASSTGLGQRSNGKTQPPALEDKPTVHTGNSSYAPCSTNTLPRSYATTSGASSKDKQLDSLMMQQLGVEKEKKEMFLDHLKQKYLQYVAIVPGHQDHMREQISKEVLYGNHTHSLHSTMSPPMVRSMPSSPSRVAHGSRARVVDPGNATLPQERISGVGRSRTVCTNSSVILARRDVKPEEDTGSIKSMALVRREGGQHYSHSYCSSLPNRGGGYLSITSSQCSDPPSHTVDIMDAGVAGIPGGLQQYRASIKPLMGYGKSMDHPTHSLHRQRSRKYGDSHLPLLGTKTPSLSMDGQIAGVVGLVSPERMSPIHRSLRQDSNGATVQIINRSRGSDSSSSTSSVFVDPVLGQPERLFQGHATASNAQSERMKAMEEQIASLAGLVHHALSMGPDVSGVKDTVSENSGHKLLNNRPGVSSEAQNPATMVDSFSPSSLVLQASPSDRQLQQSLLLAKKSVCELQVQLTQLRQLQLSNQESVNSMLRMAGQELVMLMCDQLAQSEEAAYRQRAEMEEERIHYLVTEDRIITQLSELEDYVGRLQRCSASQLPITVRDVEEGAVSLRRVGEALAILKGGFPELQAKMQSVLRLEVEAVRFLKEEPHKMDSMLKRVKALTENLSSLRRHVSESTIPAISAQEPLNVEEKDKGPLRTESFRSSPKTNPRSSVRPPHSVPNHSGSQAEVSMVGLASPIMTRRMTSTAATVIQPHSPTVVKVSPCSREGSHALHRRPGPLQSDGHCSSAQESHIDQTTITHTQPHTETTEGNLSVETSGMNPSSTSKTKNQASSNSSQPPSPSTNTDFDQVRASLMKSIPDVDTSDTRECCSDSPSGQSAPLHLTLQVTQQEPLSDTQESTPVKMSYDMDSSQLNSTDTAASQLPPATAEPPPSAPPSAASSTECSSRLLVEKSRRSSVDKEIKLSPDRTGRSPPPPPRRLHAVSSGRSGEMIFITRKEPVEVQVTRELPKKNNSSGGHQQWKGEVRTSSTSQVTNQEPPEITTCDHQSAPQLGITDGCHCKLMTAAGHEEHSEGGKDSVIPDKVKEAEENVVKQVPSLNSASVVASQDIHKNEEALLSTQKKAENMEARAVSTSQKKRNLTVNTHEQINGELVGKERSTTTAVTMAKLTTTATLNKEKIQGTDITSPGKTMGKEVPADKKSNWMVILTSQKENTPEDFSTELSPAFQLEKTCSSSCSMQQNQETTVPVSRERLQYTGEGGSLSPDICDDEGPPPPPPPNCKISLRISKTKVRPQSKEEVTATMNRSDIQTTAGDISGESTYPAHEDQGFKDSDSTHKKPIIVILNEPMDIQSAYKRLSTILECEEDHDGIFSPERIVDKEQTKQGEKQQDMKKCCTTEINMVLGLKDIIEIGQNDVHMQHQISSADNDSVPVNPYQGKSVSLGKTENKRKFKFKFPKNKLAAISQAIRAGTKTGKKTVEVVVHKEQEEIASYNKPVEETKKQIKESKRLEINSTNHFNLVEGNGCDRDLKVYSPTHSKSHRVEGLCKSTLDSIDSLEESIKQLEISLETITSPSSPSSILSSPPRSPDSASDSTDRAQLSGKVKQEREKSISKRPGSQILKDPNLPQSKRAKPQPLHDTGKSSSKKQTSSSSSNSSAPQSHTKSRHSSSSGSREKIPKGHQ